MKSCTSEKNKKNCNCSFACSRKGICCDCLTYHRSKGELPACYFPGDEEVSGDRSVKNFIRIVDDRGTGFLN